MLTSAWRATAAGLVGVVAVWAAPAGAVDRSPGRFTGGGRFSSDQGVKMTHGFTLHCSTEDGPNRLEVNWEGGNRFHLTDMYYAACSDRPNIDPRPPVAPSDVHNGEGFGRLNGVAGAVAHWRIIDRGEPGTADTIFIQIWDAQGQLVISTVTQDGSLLDQGNHQAHRETP